MSKYVSMALGMVLAGAWAASSAMAQNPPPAPSSAERPASDPEARIRELEAKVRELTAAVEALKRSAGEPDAGAVARLDRQIEALTREIEQLKLGEAGAEAELSSRHGLGPAASRIYSARSGVSVGGYGELIYRNPDSRAEDGSPSGGTDTLDLARVVLYFGYKWNDRILFNSEIEYEHASTGEGDEEKGEVSVEFAYLDFLFRPGLNARAGLLLVPVGFTNELHEPTTFPGVLRPEVERLILPTTWREAGGGVFGEAGSLAYRAYLVTGLNAAGFTGEEGIREGRQGGSNALAEDFAFAGRLDYVGRGGLLAGGSLVTGDSGQGEIGASARVTLYDLHVQYQWRGLELRGLWTRAEIDDSDAINAANGVPPCTVDPVACADSVGEAMKGWYLQAGYDLFSLGEGRGSLTPFVRYEALDTQDGVPSGFAENPAFARSLWTLGVAWKPIPQVVIKADFQDRKDDAQTGVDQFNVGLGWIF